MYIQCGVKASKGIIDRNTWIPWWNARDDDKRTFRSKWTAAPAIDRVATQP